MAVLVGLAAAFVSTLRFGILKLDSDFLTPVISPGKWVGPGNLLVFSPPFFLLLGGESVAV